MINFDDATKENIKESNPYWPQIHDHSYTTLMIGGSGSGETNWLFDLINLQPDNDKMYLHAKDQFEAKSQFLINKPKSTNLKHCNESKAFIEYPNDMDDIYKKIVK